MTDSCYSDGRAKEDSKGPPMSGTAEKQQCSKQSVDASERGARHCTAQVRNRHENTQQQHVDHPEEKKKAFSVAHIEIIGPVTLGNRAFILFRT